MYLLQMPVVDGSLFWGFLVRLLAQGLAGLQTEPRDIPSPLCHFILGQALVKLTLNLQSSCFGLQSSRIIGARYCAWFNLQLICCFWHPRLYVSQALCH